MLICGDCLSELQKLEKNSIDLIYMDPPFFTQKEQKLKNRDKTKEFAFNDRWDSITSYKNYIRERLAYCHQVLKATGSIFLHCDRSASHHLRIVLDEIFGVNRFQSEIVWIYKRWSNAKTGLLNSHQLIYFYSKGKRFKFNAMYEDYSPATNIDQIFQARKRDENNISVYKKDEFGKSILLREKKGVPLSDVWEIPYLNPKAKERVGYPTQKPIVLIERIISLVTEENDIVLDPFCGSGTTLVAAKLLGRKYIGIDILPEAIEIAKKRVANPIKSESNLLRKGRESYLNQDQNILQILAKIGAVAVQRNKGIDGFLEYDGKISPVPIKIQKCEETVEEAAGLLLKACRRNSYKFKILVKSHDIDDTTPFALSPDTKNGMLVVSNVDAFAKEKRRFLEQIEFL